MTTMTIRPADTGDSWDTGFSDGELAAMTGLSEPRALARAEMAEDHDPMYAAGYWDGYERTATLIACLADTPAVR